jgi:hypothetical protein
MPTSQETACSSTRRQVACSKCLCHESDAKNEAGPREKRSIDNMYRFIFISQQKGSYMGRFQQGKFQSSVCNFNTQLISVQSIDALVSLAWHSLLQLCT